MKETTTRYRITPRSGSVRELGKNGNNRAEANMPGTSTPKNVNLSNTLACDIDTDIPQNRMKRYISKGQTSLVHSLSAKRDSQ